MSELTPSAKTGGKKTSREVKVCRFVGTKTIKICVLSVYPTNITFSDLGSSLEPEGHFSSGI